MAKRKGKILLRNVFVTGANTSEHGLGAKADANDSANRTRAHFGNLATVKTFMRRIRVDGLEIKTYIVVARSTSQFEPTYAERMIAAYGTTHPVLEVGR